MTKLETNPLDVHTIRASVVDLFGRRTRPDAMRIAHRWADTWNDAGREDIAHEIEEEILLH